MWFAHHLTSTDTEMVEKGSSSRTILIQPTPVPRVCVHGGAAQMKGEKKYHKEG